MKPAAGLTSKSDHRLPPVPLKLLTKSFDVPIGFTTTAATTTTTSNSTFYSTISDVEMVVLRGLSYTSLKDITPSSSPPRQAAVLTSSAFGGTPRKSWDDLPIKNPLVKQAALAYLHPMLTPPEMGPRKNWLQSLKEKFYFDRNDEEDDQLGCMDFANDVVFGPIREALWRAFGFSCSSTDDQRKHLE